MKRILYVLFLISFAQAYTQSDALAKQYFNDGNFERAVVLYEKLYTTNKTNLFYFQSLVACYQQLEQYDKAEGIIRDKIKQKEHTPVYLVELGYNYFLSGNPEMADTFYQQALDSVEENPAYAYSVGGELRKKSALDYAIKVYKRAMELNPQLNFNYDLAFIYGEKGDIESMYNTYLDLIVAREANKNNVQRSMGRFLSDESSSENNQLLKRLLLKRSQTDPNVVWNELLSWLFIQQKQYKNAFVQEKAIFKRSEEPSIQRFVNLGVIALQDEDRETAKEIFGYLESEFKDPALQLLANSYLLQLWIEEGNEEEYDKIDKRFATLLEKYGKSTQTINLQISYAKFLTFQKKTPDAGEALLRDLLGGPLTRFDEASVKMALADILVYDEKFNQALIFYSQIQKTVKNDVLSQNARFKVAQTSFYKGDFEWAESQLNVLKSSTSQLIANDALQLKLLISDNSLQDSTQTALKLYARADLMGYQNRDRDAIGLLDSILMNHKGESIEDEALLKQARLYEKHQEYDKARLNYIKIIEFFPTDILADDALFYLAELYNNKLNNPEAAKPLYERIIFEHADSIFFVEARKKYRKLRGDSIN